MDYLFINFQALKPKFDHGWFGHVRAGAELIQLAGPRVFAEPVPLKLLIGFCPILVSHSAKALSRIQEGDRRNSSPRRAFRNGSRS